MIRRWMGLWVPDPFRSVTLSTRGAPSSGLRVALVLGAVTLGFGFLPAVFDGTLVAEHRLPWLLPYVGLALLGALTACLPARHRASGGDGVTSLYLALALCAALSVVPLALTVATRGAFTRAELGLFAVAVPTVYLLARGLRVASRDAVRAKIRGVALGSLVASGAAIALSALVDVLAAGDMVQTRHEVPVGWIVAGLAGVAIAASMERHLARMHEIYGDPATWREASMNGAGTITFREGGAPRSTVHEIAWMSGPVVVIPRGGGEGSLYRGDGSPHAGWVGPGTVPQLRAMVDDTRVAARALSLAALWLTAAPLWMALTLQLLR